MQFGMPLLLEAESIKKNSELCAELGLNFVELNMNMPGCLIDMTDTNRIKAVMDEFGIYFTIHTADDMNMTDFNTSVSKAHIETVVSAIKLAVKTDMPVINMHLNTGIYVTLPNERVYLFNKYIDLYMDRIKLFRKECEQAAKGTGIKICVENMDGHMDFAVRATEYLLESDVFALTLDIGHNYCADGTDEPFYKKNIEKLSHMHIHDAKGKNPHLTLGTGDINIREMIELAERRNCRAVIETKTITSLTQSVEWLKENKFML